MHLRLRSNKAAAGLAAALLSASALVAVPSAPVAGEAQIIDGPFRIAPIPGDSSHNTSQRAAYDPVHDRHLVASIVHPTGQTPWSILTTLVGADGRPIAGGQARTNASQELHTSPWHPNYDSNELDIAFNPTTNEYLVVWSQSTGPTSEVPNGARWAIMFAQRYSASGARVGGPVRLNAAPGLNATCGYSDPTVEYNPANGGYMLVFFYGMKQISTLTPANADQCPGVQGISPNVLRAAAIPGIPAVDSVTGTNVPGSLISGRSHSVEIGRHPSTGQFMVTWGTPPWKVTDSSPQTQEQMAHLISPTAQPVGSRIVVSSPGYGDGVPVVSPVTGNWVVAAVSQNDGVLLHSFRPNGNRVGPVVSGVRGVDIYSFVVLADGTYLLSTTPNSNVHHLGSTGVRLGQSQPITGSAWLSVGKPGNPVLAVGRGAQGTPLRNQTVGSLVSFGPGAAVVGTGQVLPRGRPCFGVAGSPGDLALVNLTPVEAVGGGNGQLVSSDVASPPEASNVNFGAGTVDPNVAAAPIGADGRVCYVNSAHNRVHVIADHLVSIAKSSVTLATPTGAPARKVDTREGLGGSIVGPRGRLCFAVAGSPGDVALVNLTPVLATGGGNGQLVSSDVKSPPEASNVNFGLGTVDPNVAAAPIGADGRVCYVNSAHSSVHLIADHLGTISKSAITLATPTGAPARKVDTRERLGGSMVGPRGRLCFAVAGSPGDVALVNLTPVLATGGGNGQLVSSDIASPPEASNVNFGLETVDPNVAAAPIGADGRVCYVNSAHSSVHLIADHLGTISKSAITLATPTGAPARRIDTRPPG